MFQPEFKGIYFILENLQGHVHAVERLYGEKCQPRHSRPYIATQYSVIHSHSFEQLHSHVHLSVADDFKNYMAEDQHGPNYGRRFW